MSKKRQDLISIGGLIDLTTFTGLFWLLFKSNLKLVFDFAVSGSCQAYVKEGADCAYIGFNSCGCEPGTSCVQTSTLPSPTLPVCFKKRSILKHLI
jgi:hypothetical protein